MSAEPTLRRRVQRRMAERSCGTHEDYLALLGREPAEFDRLIASMLIKVTSFFRDPDVWDELATKILPSLLARKPPGAELRVWCAGCATGEEAYSIAMLLAEALGPELGGRDVKVFGTDVDEASVAYARRGVYTEQQLASVSPARLGQWFVPSAGGFAVRKEIRRMVVFGVNNLVTDAPISRLDLLVCRNVFIYFSPAAISRVVACFARQMPADGYLFVGASESLLKLTRDFDLDEIAHAFVYRRRTKSP